MDKHFVIGTQYAVDIGCGKYPVLRVERGHMAGTRYVDQREFDGVEIGTGIIRDLDFGKVADQRNIGDLPRHVIRLEIAGSVEDLCSVAFDVVALIDFNGLSLGGISSWIATQRFCRSRIGSTIIGISIYLVQLDALPISRLAAGRLQCVEDGVFTGSSGQGHQFVKRLHRGVCDEMQDPLGG